MINLGQAHMQTVNIITYKKIRWLCRLSKWLFFLRFMIGVVMMEFRGQVGQIAKGEFTLVEGTQSPQ